MGESRYERIMREASEKAAKAPSRAKALLGGKPDPTAARERLVALRAPALPAVPQQPDPMPGANATERAYGQHLDVLKAQGGVHDWWWQPFSLRLSHAEDGPGDYYRPDFLVQLAGGELYIDETKGFMRDDARTKLKLASAIYPCFVFRLVKKVAQKNGGGWDIRVFAGRLP